MLLADSRGHRIRFDRRATADDSYGNAVNAWTEVASVRCGVDTQRKNRGEALEAGRLESTIGWKITVLKSALTMLITPEFRGEFVAGPHLGRIVNVCAVEVSADNREIIMDVETGVAT